MALFNKPNPYAWPKGLPPLAVREYRGKQEIMDDRANVWTDSPDALAQSGIHLLWVQGWAAYYEKSVTHSDNSPGAHAILTPEPTNEYDRNAVMVQAISRKPTKIGYVSADQAPGIGKLLRQERGLQARFLRGARPQFWPTHSLAVVLTNPFIMDLLWNPPVPSRFDVQSGTLKDSKKYQSDLSYVRAQAGDKRVELFTNPTQIESGKYAGQPKIGFGAFGREVGYLTYRYEQDRLLIDRILLHQIRSVGAVISEGLEDRLVATVIVPNHR